MKAQPPGRVVPDRHRSPVVYGSPDRFEVFLLSVERLVEREPDCVFDEMAVAEACDRLVDALRQRIRRTG